MVILTSFCIVFFCIQVYQINPLRYDLENCGDLERICNSAIIWVQTNINSDTDYFNHHPHSLGIFVFLVMIFRVSSFFNFMDFFAAASMVNAFLFGIMIVSVSLVCRKLSKKNGTATGIIALVLIALTQQFYYAVPNFYTDMLSIMFPSLGLLWYLCAKEASTVNKKYLWYSMLGLAFALGALIKVTVLIVLIGIIIDAAFAKKEGAFSGVLCTIAVIAIVFCVFNACVYSVYVDKDKVKEQKISFLHFIHMGLNEKYTGWWNSEDSDFAWSPMDNASKNKIYLKEIVERLRTNSIEFYMEKNKFEFGIDKCFPYTGWSYGSSAMTERAARSGSFYNIPIATANLISIYVLVLVYSICAGRKQKQEGSMVPHLSMLGILILFTVSETTGGRHVMGFFSMLVIGAVMGIDVLGMSINKSLDKFRKVP